MVWHETDGKPLFLQPRPGRHEKLFILFKFRTLANYGTYLKTRNGRFLRKSSLDEIPQLWNVLKGDMSLVGPRPLLPEYLKLYNPDQRLRHAVLPGITGWAQVNGRNAISWEEKFEFDIWYVRNRSFRLDMKILWMTFFNVLRQNNVNPVSEFERFKG